MKVLKTKNFNKSLLLATLVFLIYVGFTHYNDLLNIVVIKATKINSYQSVASYFGGVQKPVKLLVLLENNSEQRFGGGFIGSVGVLDIDQGSVKPQPVRSVYYYDYVATDNPDYYKEPTMDFAGNKIDLSYTLRDSGQSLNWPDNAKRAATIFTKESGQNVDGVIAITPEILKSLLRENGPVYLPDYQKTVTADNLFETVQIEVEAGKDKVDRKDPKTILSSLANQLIQKISQHNIKDLGGYWPTVQDLLQRHQILLYATDTSVESTLNELGYSGSLVQFSGDYLLVADENRNASKTGPYISRSISRNIEVDKEGTEKADVTITRTHTASGELFPYFDPLFNGNKFLVSLDVSQVKIVLPHGTKIIGADMDLTGYNHEAGYDVYLFNCSLEPGQTQDYHFSYQLPFKLVLNDKVVLNTYIQAQNGGFPVKYDLKYSLPDEYKVSAANKNTLKTYNNSTYGYNVTSDKDQYMSLIYEKTSK